MARTRRWARSSGASGFLPREGDEDVARAGGGGEWGRTRLRRVGGIVTGLERRAVELVDALPVALRAGVGVGEVDLGGPLGGVRLVGSRVEGLAVAPARDRELAAGEGEPVPDHVGRGLSVA